MLDVGEFQKFVRLSTKGVDESFATFRLPVGGTVDGSRNETPQAQVRTPTPHHPTITVL